MVAALPILLAVASAIRNGIASMPSSSQVSISSGVSAMHTTSLMKNAARMPDDATVIASRPYPERAFRSSARAKEVNAPESRRFATTIIMPSSSARVR